MPKRRNASGEGSISKYPQRGGYRYRWPLPNGKRGTGYAKTLKAAQQLLREALARRDAGLPEPDRRLTVAAFLTDWLENTARPSVRPTTFHSYESLTRIHLIPSLGDHKLTELTPEHVQAHIARKQKEGLSPRSVQYQRAILRRALNHALRWGKVARNVADLVDSPRVEKQKHAGLSVPDLLVLLKHLKGHPHEAMILTILTFGLRAGEAMGLRWQDVDFDKGVLHLRGQVQRLDGQGVVWVPYTKNNKMRAIPLPTPYITLLKQHRRQQLDFKMAHRDTWQEHDLLFPATQRSLGKYRAPDKLGLIFDKILQEAGLPHYRIHDLRHTTVSFLRSLHVPDSVIQAIVGHSTLLMTSQYGDVMPPLKEDAMDKMGRLLFGN